MFSDLYDTLLLLGGLQAFIMTLFLCFSKNNKIPNRLLAVMTFCWSVCCMLFSLQSGSFWESYPHLFKISAILTVTFFPPIYLYTKYMTSGENKFKKLDLLHFSPTLIYLLFSIPIFKLSADDKRDLILRHIPEDLSNYNSLLADVSDVFIMFQGITYSVLAMVLLYKYNRTILNNFSNVETLTFSWLQKLVGINLLLWSMGATGVVLSLMGNKVELRFFQSYYLSVVVVIYFISYYALKQPEVFSQLRGQVPANDNKLKDPELKQESEVLTGLMNEEKPFLDTELSLQDLADKINLSRNRLSFVINNAFEKNFFDFINDYRIEEAKSLLRDRDNESLKVEYLGRKAGFNSKASFNRIFKTKTGTTPSEYKAA